MWNFIALSKFTFGLPIFSPILQIIFKVTLIFKHSKKKTTSFSPSFVTKCSHYTKRVRISCVVVPEHFRS